MSMAVKVAVETPIEEVVAVKIVIIITTIIDNKAEIMHNNSIKRKRASHPVD